MPGVLETHDEGLATPQSSSAQGTLSWWVDTAQGALNAAFGDFLRDRENGLEIRMGFRHEGRHVEPEDLPVLHEEASRKICVFVHGLGCTEWAWSFRAAELHGHPETSFGTLLTEDLGYTPLYVRYNTGLHVSENGRRLSELIGELVAAYPGGVDEIALIGHSMGGLVARSAAHYGKAADAPWLSRLTHVFSIGSPHLGAPLEKASNMLASVLGYFDTPGTQVPAKILNARSRGIKDLRFGYIVDEDWKDREPDRYLEDNRQDVPFVDSALYCFIASTITRDPNHPLGQLIGDVLVRLPSAAGLTPEPARRLPFHIGRVLGGLHHLEIQNHPDVYAEIRRWLAEETVRGNKRTLGTGG
jgi:pimeloyl-ACP methyl ester carboxylesterase